MHFKSTDTATGLALTVIGLGAFATPVVAQTFEYDLVIIEPWDQQYNLASSHASGINDLNQVSGCATPVSGGCSFLWTLETGKTPINLAGVINDLGSIAGSGFLRYPDGSMEPIPSFSHIYGMNDSNIIVGDINGRYLGGCQYLSRSATVWDPQHGTRRLDDDLGILNADQARAINEFNEIVGVRSSTNSCGDSQAFLYNLDTGEFIDIHRELVGSALALTEVFDINDNSEVVGEGPYGQKIGEVGPFTWSRASGFRFLPAIPNGITMNTHANGLNNFGQVVGMGIVDDLEWHGFIWDEVSGMRDLNDTTAGIPNGFVIDRANDINENGWIIGSGHTGTWSPERAIVLIPRSGSAYSMSVQNLVGGADAIFSISNATPNRNQYIVYSLRGLGSTFVPQLNVTLDLAQPQLLTSGRADANGMFQTSVHVPQAASGRTVWFQGAEANRTTSTVERVVQ